MRILSLLSKPARAPRAPAPAALSVPAPASRAEAAFTAEYRRLSARALVFLGRYVSPDDAEELVQASFVRLWEVYYTGEELPTGSIKPLFYRILRNRLISYTRRPVHESIEDNEDVLDLTAHLTNRSAASQVAESNMLAGRLEYLVAALPPRMRQAYEIFDRGVELEEMAREMGLEVQTARWYLTEALRRLRHRLVKEGYDVPAPMLRGRHGGNTK